MPCIESFTVVVEQGQGEFPPPLKKKKKKKKKNPFPPNMSYTNKKKANL